jgi:hypothetical protein
MKTCGDCVSCRPGPFGAEEPVCSAPLPPWACSGMNSRYVYANTRADDCPAYCTPDEHRLRLAAPALLAACLEVLDTTRALGHYPVDETGIDAILIAAVAAAIEVTHEDVR